MKPARQTEKQLSLPEFDKVPTERFDFVGFFKSLVRFSTVYVGLTFGTIVLVQRLLPPAIGESSYVSAISIATIAPLIPATLLWSRIEHRIDQRRERKNSRIAIFPENK